MCSALSRYTTLGIGGPPKRLVVANSASELIDNADALILGCGSNVLVSDDGYDGTVVINRFESATIDGDTAVVGSGTRLGALCSVLCENDLGGMEWAAGIPASVGGAVVMNAGAFGGEMKDVLLYADVLRGGKLIRIDVSELGLGYRSSDIDRSDIVVSVALKLVRRDRRQIKALMSEYSAKRRATQPCGKSAGSTFKNQSGVPVAKLLDECGFKGYRIGGAMVSHEHANIIVNTGGATARDVCKIIATLKDALKGLGVTAEEEIIYIGEF